ncbi:MAG: UDP-N-acetylglucosamine 2-epimerase [Gammaproteobacteria bacterium]|nr:UDP-N-acetylglucosamine 2-epimerase [Gammaproteobacteria bacterium]
MRKVLVVVGTDSEAIRALPLIHSLRAVPSMQTVVCIAAQDSQLLAAELASFGFLVDEELELIRQTLNANVSPGVDRVIGKHKPDCVLVYGDACKSMASFSGHSLFGCLGAGLRMYELRHHSAESANPRGINLTATRYFVSSVTSRDNLLEEGVAPENVFLTDSTEVDAALMVAERIRNDDVLRTKLAADFPFLDPDKRLILIAGYRHENRSGHMASLSPALKCLAMRSDLQIVCLACSDSGMDEVMDEKFAGLPNITFVQPQDYLHSVYLMLTAYFIITGPDVTPKEVLALGKPVLEMRDLSGYRDAGAIDDLAERDADRILQECARLLDDPACYRTFSFHRTPHGDGHASQRIVETLLR